MLRSASRARGFGYCKPPGGHSGIQVMSDTVTVNRAPVLTLWAAVVAERLGFRWEEALTLGRALAGLNAQSKGRRLGIFSAPEEGEAARGHPARRSGSTSRVELLGRAIPAVKTPGGIRALDKDAPIDPESVQRYLEAKFHGDLGAATEAMRRLAGSLESRTLGEQGFALYESFRPKIPSGARGWGKAGVLDLGLIRRLARGGRGA
jgi:hypothetical protein